MQDLCMLDNYEILIHCWYKEKTAYTVYHLFSLIKTDGWLQTSKIPLRIFLSYYTISWFQPSYKIPSIIFDIYNITFL